MRTSFVSSSTDRSAGKRSSDTPARLRVLGSHRDDADFLPILGAFCDRYNNPNTDAQYRRLLTDLFRTTHRRHPADLTEQDLIDWCSGSGKQIANNSIRSRTALARTFLGWCLRNDHVSDNRMEDAAGPDGPLRFYPRTYGKVQAQNPGRWLTKDEAFGTLLASCADDGLPGLRDELVLRLGLLGMRASEIGRLRIGNVIIEGKRTHLSWTGKGYKPRTATAGQAFTAVLGRWLDAYTTGLGHTPTHDAPLICPQITTRWARLAGIRWRSAP
jgi:site-specific recombinase XerD